MIVRIRLSCSSKGNLFPLFGAASDLVFSFTKLQDDGQEILPSNDFNMALPVLCRRPSIARVAAPSLHTYLPPHPLFMRSNLKVRLLLSCKALGRLFLFLHALSFITSNQLKCRPDRTCCLFAHQAVPPLKPSTLKNDNNNSPRLSSVLRG